MQSQEPQNDSTCRPALSSDHWETLTRGSGIATDVIASRGYRTLSSSAELRALGFSKAQARVPALLLPVHTPDGSQPLFQIRPDNPRLDARGKPRKYEIPAGSGIRIDCPPVCRNRLGDPSVELYITEGIKKADALASQDLCAVAVMGVWGFRGRNEFGGTAVLADLDYIALRGRTCRVCYDSDVATKPQVQKALTRLTEHLQRKGAVVEVVYLPPDPGGEKVGVDDFLLIHTPKELAALAQGPKPEIKAAAPVVELLDDAPARISRPLTLIGDRGYAATWLWVRCVRTEVYNEKRGEIIRLDPPQETKEQRLFIVRDDGRVYGEGADDPLETLGFDIHLSEIPQPSRLWSPRGVKAYRRGERPDPCDVFRRVVDVVDQFIDFSRSLGPQRTMAEMVACYIVATYFLEAFVVFGYLWPTGDWGTGKTKLQDVVAETAYLGQLLLSGSTYAALRDLADYGATLCFDDAESLSDQKRTDPDKRNLLLAGNRRGSVVTVKEPVDKRTWRTRHVNAFCPRLFSATRIPDPILASRTIVVPLVRTGDKAKADAEPQDTSLWCHDRRTLVDDLWATALAHLGSLRGFDRLAASRAGLSGRNLEPWRPILAAALWLEEGCGVAGLFGRMRGLMHSYQGEREDLEPHNISRIVIKALIRCATRANSAISASMTETPTTYRFTIQEVREAALEVLEEEEAGNPERYTNQRVGRALGSLRLKRPPRPGGKGSRQWLCTSADLKALAQAYSIASDLDDLESDNPHGLQSPHLTGPPGTNGTNGTPREPAQGEPESPGPSVLAAEPTVVATDAAEREDASQAAPMGDLGRLGRSQEAETHQTTEPASMAGGVGTSTAPTRPHYPCGGRSFWRDQYRIWHCETCQAAASPGHVVERIEVEGDGESDGAR